jgi:hypothetical protein
MYAPESGSKSKAQGRSAAARFRIPAVSRPSRRSGYRCPHPKLEVVFPVITVVSGLPRSGTSLMMEMIVAGGIPPLTDGLRSPDDIHPRGCFEWEPAKSLKQHPEAIGAAEGKVVKIISALLPLLPDSYEYRVVFMIRTLGFSTEEEDRSVALALGTRALGADITPRDLSRTDPCGSNTWPGSAADTPPHIRCAAFQGSYVPRDPISQSKLDIAGLRYQDCPTGSGEVKLAAGPGFCAGDSGV